MRGVLKLSPLSILAGCAQACAIGKALYIAVVHNSGAPPRAEMDRIAARQDTMMRDLSRARVVVLPVTILGREQRVDVSAATRLAESLSTRGVHATAASSAVTLPYEPQPNEALTFWTRFRALGDSIRAHPIGDADYVLAVDVMGAPERSAVGAVHAVTVTGRGELAYRGAWNSAQPLYKEIRPRSIDDATRMVLIDMTRRAER
jgi:hypothetical protein